MGSTLNFINDAHDIYLKSNQRAMNWQLGRMKTSVPLINTKLNSLSLQEYNHDDGLRSPDFVYGWIQGRGLEALVFHARYFSTVDRQLSHRLFNAAEALYAFLCNLIASQEGAFFLYDSNLQPVCRDDPAGGSRQLRAPDIATYSDLFCTGTSTSAFIDVAQHYSCH